MGVEAAAIWAQIKHQTEPAITVLFTAMFLEAGKEPAWPEDALEEEVENC